MYVQEEEEEEESKHATHLLAGGVGAWQRRSQDNTKRKRERRGRPSGEGPNPSFPTSERKREEEGGKGTVRSRAAYSRVESSSSCTASRTFVRPFEARRGSFLLGRDSHSLSRSLVAAIQRLSWGGLCMLRYRL